MKGIKLDGHDLQAIGYPRGPLVKLGLEAAESMLSSGMDKNVVLGELEQVWNAPDLFVNQYGKLAQAIINSRRCVLEETIALREGPVPHRIWGREMLDDATIEQFKTALMLPVSIRGAQMSDGHVGYGLTIGGVLAVENAVIPYAVGVDIACRMRMTILDDPPAMLEDPNRYAELRERLITETRFGIGANFDRHTRRSHAVMDDPLWTTSPIIEGLKDKAWEQLGTSGSGNHFAEIGVIEIPEDIVELGVEGGKYLAILSHSGSRGFGSKVAEHFTKIAKSKCRLPKEAENLAWLSLDDEAGVEYWAAMTLAGDYAAANHELIHNHLVSASGLTCRAHIENHHNFAWKEDHDGRQMIVHRKGATPAGADVLGVIPGTMADYTHLIRGKGNPESLNSASHGAGRLMSRKAAKQNISQAQMDQTLKERGIDLISAGRDEAPQAYKKIAEVMEAQKDLVETIGLFLPRIVRMADGGPAED